MLAPQYCGGNIASSVIAIVNNRTVHLHAVQLSSLSGSESLGVVGRGGLVALRFLDSPFLLNSMAIRAGYGHNWRSTKFFGLLVHISSSFSKGDSPNLIAVCRPRKLKGLSSPGRKRS